MGRLLFILACAFPQAAPAAALGEFAPRFPRSLFTQPAEPPAVDPDDLPNPNEDPARGGDFGVATWFGPFLRFFSNPDAEATTAIGLQFVYRPYDAFGLVADVSIGDMLVFPNNPAVARKIRDEGLYGTYLEISAGARVYAHQWGSGAIYLDVRGTYMVSEGEDPILRTQSYGADLLFGLELGVKPFWFFLEGGYGFRDAIFKSRVGWVSTPDRFDDMGWHADFGRLGFRFYF